MKMKMMMIVVMKILYKIHIWSTIVGDWGESSSLWSFPEAHPAKVEEATWNYDDYIIAFIIVAIIIVAINTVALNIVAIINIDITIIVTI